MRAHRLRGAVSTPGLSGRRVRWRCYKRTGWVTPREKVRMGDDRKDSKGESGSSEVTKHEYRRPELRELGTLAELTDATNAGGPGADSTYATSQ